MATNTVKILGKDIRKQLLWGLALIPIIMLLFTSTALAKLAGFIALVVFNAVFSFFHVRLRVPLDITPLTLSLLITGYFFGLWAVIVLFIFGGLLPGILAGSGLGPSSFVYIPLNIGLGIIFPMFAHSLVFSLFIFLLLYAFLIFIIDGFFFSSFVRSLAMAAGFLLTNLIYLAVVWRIQTFFAK